MKIYAYGQPKPLDTRGISKDPLSEPIFPHGSNSTWQLSEQPSGFKGIMVGLLITFALVLVTWFCISNWGCVGP